MKEYVDCYVIYFKWLKKVNIINKNKILFFSFIYFKIEMQINVISCNSAANCFIIYKSQSSYFVLYFQTRNYIDKVRN